MHRNNSVRFVMMIYLDCVHNLWDLSYSMVIFLILWGQSSGWFRNFSGICMVGISSNLACWYIAWPPSELFRFWLQHADFHKLYTPFQIQNSNVHWPPYWIYAIHERSPWLALILLPLSTNLIQLYPTISFSLGVWSYSFEKFNIFSLIMLINANLAPGDTYKSVIKP